jgi:hypothetical protein
MAANIVFIFYFAENGLNLDDVVEIFFNIDWNMNFFQKSD